MEPFHSRIAFGLIFTLLILIKSLRAKSLSLDGCIAAFFVGLTVSISSLCHFSVLFSFFIICSIATKYKEKEKKKYDPDYKKGGQRNAIQVLCNGFAPTLFSALYVYYYGFGEIKIDFKENLKASICSLAVIAGLSCACGDTLASELGTVLNKNDQVYLITSFRKVPKGTNGGVSLVGTLASVFGGFLIGVSYYIFQLGCFYYKIGLTESQWKVILIGTMSGLIGSLIDSILGASLQYSGIQIRSKKIHNTPSFNVEHISGLDILTNNQVNFISCVLTSVLIPFFLYFNKLF